MSTQCTRSNVLTADSLADQMASLPVHKDGWRRIHRRSCHPQRFAMFERPSKCSEPMPCMISSKCLRMRASQAVHSPKHSGEDDSTAFRAHSGFPLESRVSLMLVKMLISVMGVNRTPLQRFLGGWRSPSLFDEKYVSCTAATSLHPSSQCRLNQALLDELLLVTGLAPLLETNLRRNPAKHSTLQTLLRVPLAAAPRP